MKNLKKISVLVVLIAFSYPLLAQKTTIRVLPNLSLFSFAGKGVTKSTLALVNPRGGKSSVLTPFGSKYTPSYGITVDVRHITKDNFVEGVDFGLDILRSNVKIGGIENTTPSAIIISNASGDSYLTHQFLTLNPYYGYRFQTRGVNIEWTFGVDIAYNFTGKAKLKVNSPNTVFESAIKSTMWDVRPNTQIALSLADVLGLYISYAHGLVNYKADVLNTESRFSRLIRLGLIFRVH